MDRTVFNVDHQLFSFGIGRFGTVFTTPSMLSLGVLAQMHTEELWLLVGGTRSTEEERDDFIQEWPGVIQQHTSGQNSVHMEVHKSEEIAEFV